MMNKPIRFGFFGGPHNDYEFCQMAEGLGVDALAWGESPVQFPDPYLCMLQAAQHTKTALLGTVVTCPGLRHPAVHANTLQELQRLSGGRIFCGIGTGDLALIEMGEKPYKMRDFVTYATAVRDLTAGREIEWNGRPLRMRTEPVKPVPLWFGADGPRGIAEASRVADGVVVAQAGSADVISTVIERAASAAADAGRSIDDLDIWFMLRVVPTERVDGAIYLDGFDEYATRALRFMWRTAGSPTQEDDLAGILLNQRGYRIDPDVADRICEFNARWDESRSFGSKHHVELMDELKLRDFAGRYFFISGPPAHIAERTQALIDAGARNFFTPFMAGDRYQLARETAQILNELR
jgi:alkanesulfonate monooxygenase SsuD/methylene tetrahydromethanopterin reductase-like flavin-dependent oxidoreductase (luciferase family)